MWTLINEAGGEIPRLELLVIENTLQERDIGGDATDTELSECTA
jgi:hypothetical protein